MGRVAGKAALVAGAGGGIGGAGAVGLAREGASVFCTDRDGAAAPGESGRARSLVVAHVPQHNCQQYQICQSHRDICNLGSLNMAPT